MTNQSSQSQSFFDMLIWSYTTFNGLANRKPYLLSMLVLNILCGLVLTYIGKDAPQTLTGKTVYLLQLVASLAISLKRAHDLNHSWKWLLLLLIPVVNLYPLIKLAFSRGTYGPNKYGEDPLNYAS